MVNKFLNLIYIFLIIWFFSCHFHIYNKCRSAGRHLNFYYLIFYYLFKCLSLTKLIIIVTADITNKTPHTLPTILHIKFDTKNLILNDTYITILLIKKIIEITMIQIITFFILSLNSLLNICLIKTAYETCKSHTTY